VPARYENTMHKYLALLGFVIALVVSGFTDQVFAKSADNTRFFDLSLPHLHPFEQVTEITCLVLGGGITEVSVPAQWNVDVDSSVGGRAKLTAFAVVGASAFYQSELGPFHHGFMTIAKDPSRLHILSFDVTVVLTITNNDMGNERKVTFTKKQMVLTESAKRSPWW
jgi:hypothetical protein